VKAERDRKVLGADVRMAVLDRLLARQGHDLSRIRVEVVPSGLWLRFAHCGDDLIANSVGLDLERA